MIMHARRLAEQQWIMPPTIHRGHFQQYDLRIALIQAASSVYDDLLRLRSEVFGIETAACVSSVDEYSMLYLMYQGKSAFCAYLKQ